MKQKLINKFSESSEALLYESASGNQVDDLPLELIRMQLGASCETGRSAREGAACHFESNLDGS